MIAIESIPGRKLGRVRIELARAALSNEHPELRRSGYRERISGQDRRSQLLQETACGRL